MSGVGSGVRTLLEEERDLLDRLESSLRAEERSFGTLETAVDTGAAGRDAALVRLSEIRSTLTPRLQGAGASDRQLERESRERARNLLERSRALVARYAARREELGAALTLVRGNRGLAAAFTSDGAGRLDLKR